MKRIVGSMVLGLGLLASACVVGEEGNEGGDADGDGAGDGSGTGSGSGSGSGAACPLPEDGADTGDLAALKAQQCNVAGSQGQRKWYRLSATIPGTQDVVQVELWDGRGAFTGGAVTPGTYQITGAETDHATCGVCVRALGDRGGAGQKEYFASGGSVEITAVGGNGAPIAATITNVTFDEVDPTTHQKVTGGCTAALARSRVSGTVISVSGGGGGGGGCPATIGD